MCQIESTDFFQPLPLRPSNKLNIKPGNSLGVNLLLRMKAKFIHFPKMRFTKT